MSEEELYNVLKIKDSMIDELIRKLDNKESIIKEAIKYIKEHCIDEEFYINLSYKEKGIVDVLTILENGSDNNEQYI